MELEAGSFRDRAGRIYYSNDRVFRALTEAGLAQWRDFGERPFFRRLVADGKVVESRLVEPPPDELPAGHVAVLEHEVIPFISYPYEWSFGMLRAAALLQLEILNTALDEGVTLKDATPYNVQWRGPRPVFIDVLSFRVAPAGEPWVGYRQFCQLFLYPLLLEARLGVPFQPWLRGRLEGVTATEFSALLSFADYFRPRYLLHVLLHARSQERFEARGARAVQGALAGAGFSSQLIRNNLRRLAQWITELRPPERATTWAAYGDDTGYAEGDRSAKERFVTEALATRRWRLTWDLGANTGTFSRLAAVHCDQVVALEADRGAVERLFAASTGFINLLPLICDLADPSPDQGWNGRERRRLEARGRPDLVLCLALVHHLVIGAHLRLDELLDWLAGLGGHLLIEFPHREDPMVQRLLGQKDETYQEYDLARFEAALDRRFEILRRQTIPGGNRSLYFTRSRAASFPSGDSGGASPSPT